MYEIQRLVEPDKPFAGVVFAEHLVAMVAVDSPTAARTLTEQDIRDAGGRFSDVLELALRQMRRPTQADFIKLGDGVFRSLQGDFYTSSWPLFPEVFESLGLRGKPLIVVASRQSVFVTASDEPQGTDDIMKYAAQIFSQELPISTRIYRLDGHGWRTWTPTIPRPETPIAELFESLDQVDYATAIGGTHEHIQRIVGDQVSVVQLSVVPNINSRYVTLAFWLPDGGPALVPEAERVALLKATGDSAGADVVVIVTWETLTSVLGTKLQPDGRYPQRFLWNSSLTDDDWQRLQDAPAADLKAIRAPGTE
jgi:hypothetical protein